MRATRDHCYDNPKAPTPPSISPLDSIPPVTTDEIAEKFAAATVCAHALGDTKQARRADALELLELLDALGIPDPRPAAGGEA